MARFKIFYMFFICNYSTNISKYIMLTHMARLQIKRKVTICRPGFVRSLDGDGEHWNVYVVAVFLIFIFICFAWGTFEHWNVYIVAVFLTLIFNLLWIGW